MSFFARLLGRQSDNGCGKGLPPNNSSKRQQPCSPPSGSFVQEIANGRPVATQAVPVKLQNGSAFQQQQAQQQRSSMDSDEDDCTIRVPGSLSCSGDRNRSNSLARRRAAIDISPKAVQRFSEKVAALDAGHLDVDGGGVTRTEVEALYTDMQLIHRGRSSMVYRAREVRSGRRVILKAYDAHTLGNSTRKQALERQILTLRAAQTAAGPSCGLVMLERVVENTDGTYLVVQACNGGTLIEAMANSGGHLPERQVAIKVALPLLTALKQLHSTGIVHRDIKPEHLMIHNGSLKVGDFGSAGCSSLSAATLASTLQKQALAAARKRQALQTAAADGQPADIVHQQQLLVELEALQHTNQVQVQLQADCTVDAVPSVQVGDACAAQQQQQSHATPARFGCVAGDSVSGILSPSVSGRLSVQAVKDAMNFRIGSIEHMAPEMLNKPTAAEVFHLVIAQGIDEDDLPTYDDKVDVWSMGVVLYEALSGIQPFLANSSLDMLSVIGKKMAQRVDPEQQQQQQHHVRHRSHQHWCFKQPQELPAFVSQLQVSPDAKDFLACCLTWDPQQRSSAEQLLAHPWVLRMQDEAAAVAASRASSRRVSMQASMRDRARISDADISNVSSAAASTRNSKMQQPCGDDSSAISLIDPLMSDMLTGRDVERQYSRANSLDLMATGLERSMTTEQLEVGAHNVLRTHTQRLGTRPMHARVHTA